MNKHKDIKKNKIINHFKIADPIIYKEIRKMNLEIFSAEKDTKKYFHRLCRDIIGQQLSGKAADAIIDKFEKLFTTKNITPSHVLVFSDEDYRQVGMSWAKAKYIRDLAQKVQKGEVRIEKLQTMKDGEVIEELVKVKGIGPWTAEMFLIFTLGREDVFSKGDLGLRNAVNKLYNLKSKKDDSKINKIAQIWSPYRSYASLALWNYLDK